MRIRRHDRARGMTGRLVPSVPVGGSSAWEPIEALASRLSGSPAASLGLVAAFFGLLFLRAPDILLHAGLWGEDGWFFYPDAYNAGTASLLWPNAGYLQIFPRLVALAVQPVPLIYVPALFAATGLLTQAIAAAFIASNRMAIAWPSALARFLFALIYLMLPNSWEVYGSLVDAQWHLAVLAFCVVVSAPPANWRQATFDTAALTVSGLTGPFCLLLLPVAAWQAIAERASANWWRGAILAAAAAVQSGFLSTGFGTRSHLAPLGATPMLFARIVALQVFFGALLGAGSVPALIHTAAWRGNVLPIVICFAGLGLGTAAAILGPPLLRKAAAFAGMSFAAALVTPVVSETVPQWLAMTKPIAGERYYLFPILTWVGALYVLAADRRRVLRALGLMLILTTIGWGVRIDWRTPFAHPSGFSRRAEAFMKAPAGTRMEFPLRSGGSPMVLVKRK